MTARDDEDHDFSSANNETFIQLQNTLIQIIDAEDAGTKPIDITRMIATRLSGIQTLIAKQLGGTHS